MKRGLQENDIWIWRLSSSLNFYRKECCFTKAQEQKRIPTAPLGMNIDENIEKAKDMNLQEFFETVKNKSEWSYKQQRDKYQDFGNFNFGDTGKAPGFPENILLRGADWTQEEAKISKPEWGHWHGIPPFEDDSDDQYLIKKRFDYYDSNK